MSHARALSTTEVLAFSDRFWEHEILPTLSDYIRIPNKSQAFDPHFHEHGHMDRAVALIEAWCKRQPIPGLVVEVHRLPGRAPLIWMEIPGEGDHTVLLYGHLDKQPEGGGWREGLSPWSPVREGDRLYGRGGADDGYSSFAALTALRILHEHGVPHARAVVIIEAGEESGSPDLPAYIELLAPRIGSPSLVVCLDSGCGNYDQLWSTTSLRGLVSGVLTVRVLTQGVHSGAASGIVPSSFRILRSLISRVENETTGRVELSALHGPVPAARRTEAEAAAAVLGPNALESLPWAGGAGPVGSDLVELLLNQTWRPTLSITGIDGIPPIEIAGNVLRPYTSVKLSLRLPPRVDAHAASAALQQTLCENPPYGAEVTFSDVKAAGGWDAPALAPWLSRATNEASRAFFGRPAMAMGEGGSIPFMAMLGERFPAAQFLITGVLGPQSNAHGPDEFLHIPAVKRLTCSIASVLGAHARH